MVPFDLHEVSALPEPVQVIECDLVHGRRLDTQVGDVEQLGSLIRGLRDAVLEELVDVVDVEEGSDGLVEHLSGKLGEGHGHVHQGLLEICHVGHVLEDLFVRVFGGACQLDSLAAEITPVLYIIKYVHMLIGMYTLMHTVQSLTYVKVISALPTSPQYTGCTSVLPPLISGDTGNRSMASAIQFKNRSSGPNTVAGRTIVYVDELR